MEIEIKKLVDKLTIGEHQYIIPLKILVTDYIKSFLFDPQVVKYSNVVFVFKAYPFFNRFLCDDIIVLKDFIINIANHCIAEFNRLPLGHIDRVNNFQAHRLRIVSTAGYILGIQNYIKWTEFQLKVFISSNLRKDGSNLDLELRDSLSYLV